MNDVEAILGYQFKDVSLLASACSVSQRRFGPLEHLGDTIGDLAVGITCWQNGIGADAAARLVCNEALTAVYWSRLHQHVDARSGDVVEALVGAVHLDGGFEAAAKVAVELCAGHLSWEPLGEVATDGLLASFDDPPATWVGALAIEAIIADAIVCDVGSERTSQRELTAIRQKVASSAAMLEAARVSDLSDVVTDRPSAAALQASAATTLLWSVWETTSVIVTTLLLKRQLGMPPIGR